MTFVVNRRSQSTAARRPQPAALALFSLAVCGLLAAVTDRPAHAQQPATVRRDGTPLAGDPSGRPLLGRLAAGIVLVPQASRGGGVQVTVDGWIVGTAVAAADRDGHTLALRRDEYLRAVPNGRLVARLVKGALVDSVEQRDGWYHVRRAGWVASRALAGLVAGAAPTGQAAVADTSGAADTADVRNGVLRRAVRLYHAPDSPAAGMLEAGVPIRVTARAGDWVRVEAAGWVRASELQQAGGQAVSGVTAADLRAAPDEWRGKVIRWTIQFIALQTADELRPDFAPGQPYILARGPAPEYAFVYVVVPPDKVAAIARLQPLDSVTIVARVKSGRSTYLANPILELVDVVP